MLRIRRVQLTIFPGIEWTTYKSQKDLKLLPNSAGWPNFGQLSQLKVLKSGGKRVKKWLKYEKQNAVAGKLL